MRKWYKKRYLDLLGSIYIYNEHRGYTAIDRVLEAICARWPDDHALIAKVEKHRADERKHYLMFRRWFERRGCMPLSVDRTCGHIDRFVTIMFRSTIDDLDPLGVIGRDDLFERMCRVISLTERRGHRQVQDLLRHAIVRSDPQLMKIFRIIEQDEPSHWAPYEEWLRAHGGREPRWWERAIDKAIHSELLFVKLPILFLSPRTERLARWPDEADATRPQPQTAEVLAA
ncbi:MAG TPA: ferritin-like domain-containing protein [Sphingomicrobium sp.]|nr:ferritin-like domain-containing protein [Sphingomicrobium sp.]